MKTSDQVEQDLSSEQVTADDEANLLKMKEDIQSTKYDKHDMIRCSHGNGQNIKGVVYCHGCHKLVVADPERMQEARDNLQLVCLGDSLALQISWKDNRKSLRGKGTVNTDYNRKCKKYLKRAEEDGHWSIYDHYVNCPEWAAVLRGIRNRLFRG